MKKLQVFLKQDNLLLNVKLRPKFAVGLFCMGRLYEWPLIWAKIRFLKFTSMFYAFLGYDRNSVELNVKPFTVVRFILRLEYGGKLVHFKW